MEAHAAPVGAPSPAGPVHRASFHGTGGALFGIHIVNIFLTLVTLGLYRFWARVRVRKFLYGQTEFEGDRFAYHGTGREAFLGWLRAMAYVGLPLVGLRVLEPFVASIPALLLLKLLGAAIALLVVPVAIVGAWRYRLSRTEWRGIRFSFRGSAGRAIRLFAVWTLLTVLSLGLYFPVLQVNIHRFLVKDAYFGTRQFGFDGDGADLVGPFALVLLLALAIAVLAAAGAPFTYGLSVVAGAAGVAWCWFHYTARKHRFVMGHTTFDGARFSSTVTGGGLFRLGVGNLLLTLCTFGLAAPWVQVRSVRYTLDHLALTGPLDLASIEQAVQAASATGEGMTDLLDADAFEIGVGV